MCVYMQICVYSREEGGGERGSFPPSDQDNHALPFASVLFLSGFGDCAGGLAGMEQELLQMHPGCVAIVLPHGTEGSDLKGGRMTLFLPQPDLKSRPE